ncbi:hypothetical protein ACLOJK_009054 [Asimina triloba]
MGSANNRFPSSHFQTPKMPSRSSDTEDKTPPSSSSQSPPPSVPPLTFSVDAAAEDALLLRSDFLTRPELLRRRSRRVKQLAKYYRAQYWALMEEIKLRHREYYWKYGKNPFVEEEEEEGGEREGGGETSMAAEGSGENSGGQRFGKNERRCTFAGCKSTAMVLSCYCHPHILSDRKQKLYKACSYVIKRSALHGFFSAQTGPIVCGKPVLRAAVPSLCNAHFQMAQKHVSRALKKAGLHMTLATKPAPKFHVIIAEYVHQIQARRKEAQRAVVENMMVKEERALELLKCDG